MKFWDTVINPDGTVRGSRLCEASTFAPEAVAIFADLLKYNPGPSFREPIPAMHGVELQLSRGEGAAFFTYWYKAANAPLIQGLLVTGRNPEEEKYGFDDLDKVVRRFAKAAGLKGERLPKLPERPAVISAILTSGAKLMMDAKHTKNVATALQYAAETEPILGVAYFRELAEGEG